MHTIRLAYIAKREVAQRLARAEELRHCLYGEMMVIVMSIEWIDLTRGRRI